jgi:hypothetical protein
MRNNLAYKTHSFVKPLERMLRSVGTDGDLYCTPLMVQASPNGKNGVDIQTRIPGEPKTSLPFAAVVPKVKLKTLRSGGFSPPGDPGFAKGWQVEECESKTLRWKIETNLQVELLELDTAFRKSSRRRGCGLGIGGTSIVQHSVSVVAVD